MNESARPTAPAGLPPRWRAVAVHLGLTIVAAGLVAWLVQARWFPGFHFAIDGGWQGLRIALVAQLVLGPLLTLVIFNPGKARHLIVFDLVCIGAAQAGALLWGLHAIHQQRPLSINYYDGVFYSMPARSVRAEPGVAAALAGHGGPALVFVAPPANDGERRHAADRAERRQLAHEDAFFFRPFAAHWADVQGGALDPAGTADAPFARELPAFLARHGAPAQAFRFFRYQGGYGSCILALSAAGAVVGALGCERA